MQSLRAATHISSSECTGCNNQSDATTDAAGHVQFAAALMKGRGAAEPIAVMATSEASKEFSRLELTRSAFDLSDRGVDGRAQPGPVDAFLYSERGVYRPGETVSVLVARREQLVRITVTVGSEPPKSWRLDIDPAMLARARTKAPSLSWIEGDLATADLRHADVFYTVMGPPAQHAETAAGLTAAKPHLRATLGRQVRMKYLPDLHFQEDPGLEQGLRIEAILREIHEHDADRDAHRGLAQEPPHVSPLSHRPHGRMFPGHPARATMGPWHCSCTAPRDVGAPHGCCS